MNYYHPHHHHHPDKSTPWLTQSKRVLQCTKWKQPASMEGLLHPSVSSAVRTCIKSSKSAVSHPRAPCYAGELLSLRGDDCCYLWCSISMFKLSAPLMAAAAAVCSGKSRESRCAIWRECSPVAHSSRIENFNWKFQKRRHWSGCVSVREFAQWWTFIVTINFNQNGARFRRRVLSYC